MKHGILFKLGLSLSATLLLASGCHDPDDVSTMGTARVRIQAASTSAGEISLVTVSAQGGFETELTRDASGAFAGSLLLPAGPNELVGRAFAGDQLVGESAPVPVEIQAGFVTAASIRILDVTGSDDVGHSPIVLSLTHPLSASANSPVQLAVSAVDPDGDALDITWSSDCEDDSFSTTSGAETEWSKASAGSCRVSVSVGDGALDTTEAFDIVVFDESQTTGAVDLDGEFVSAPGIFLQLGLPETSCEVFPGVIDGTCDGSIASPDRAFISAFVDWGNASPGEIEVTDDCGGVFEAPFSDPFLFDASWLPPVEQSVCLIQARATSAEGLTSELSAAVLVRDGVLEQPNEFPHVFMDMNYGNGFCSLLPEQNETFCDAPIFAGDVALATVQIDWGDQPPGDLSIFDTCGGSFEFFAFDPLFMEGEWRPPIETTECTLVVQTFDVNGDVEESRMQIFVEGGEPPPPPPPPPEEPQAFVIFEHLNGACEIAPGQNLADCPPMLAGDSGFLHVEVDWGVTEPGVLDVRDDCGGELIPFINDGFLLEGEWQAPIEPSECLLSVTASGADGQVHAFDMLFLVE